ncbi:cell division protein FtsW [Candidatus Gottesmanbacteria bacterium]|nr:cell division protein FtsW [Candidatus Gottesmanbacteria bacterium]MBI5452779.1 cell division protein FtsW [Candidatus Gottesmanbacteria bacterium]
MRVKDKLKLLQQNNRVDYLVAALAIFFTLFGLLMIFESSNVSAFRDFGDQYHFVRDQSIYFLIGLGGMIAAAVIPYKKYYYWSMLMMLLTIVLLFSVFIPGIGIKALGAYRWLGFGSINFQPAEFAKLSLIFYLSAWFSNKEKGRLLPFLLLLFLVVGLVILQPDLGTAIIITTIAVSLYFVSGASIWHFLFFIPFFLLAVVGLIITSPYRFSRLTTFFNPNIDPLGSSYHIRQILISLGSGGFFGVGLGSSVQKYQFLPEASTDSIFAIIGEEFGFLGAAVFILIYLFFLYKIYKIVKNAPDKHGFLLGAGILAFFAFQAGINLGAITAIFPLTGVPLPFISYGGSNLIISLFTIGIILNISRMSAFRGRR